MSERFNPIVTFIFDILSGIEFKTGKSKFSSGSSTKTLSWSKFLSLIFFDKILPNILHCPTCDPTPIELNFLLLELKLFGMVFGNSQISKYKYVNT